MIESHDDAALETLDAAALGIDPGAPWPLVFTPGRDWSPLVISFPHVGLEWPADEPHPRPAIDFARNADLAVHHLYPDAAALGAATVCARFTRTLIDLNRPEDDVSAALVPDHPAPRPRQPPWATAAGARPGVHNRGLIWRTALGNVQILAGTLPYAELQRRLHRYYHPYHRALELLLAELVAVADATAEHCEGGRRLGGQAGPVARDLHRRGLQLLHAIATPETPR